MVERPPRHASQVAPTCYRVADLAERWSCSTGKVRTLLAKGELPSFDLGGMVRIPINDVIAYEARCLQQVKPVPAPGSPESPAATLGTSMTHRRRISTGCTDRAEAEAALAAYLRGHVRYCP